MIETKNFTTIHSFTQDYASQIHYNLPKKENLKFKWKINEHTVANALYTVNITKFKYSEITKETVWSHLSSEFQQKVAPQLEMITKKLQSLEKVCQFYMNGCTGADPRVERLYAIQSEINLKLQKNNLSEEEIKNIQKKIGKCEDHLDRVNSIQGDESNYINIETTRLLETIRKAIKNNKNTLLKWVQEETVINKGSATNYLKEFINDPVSITLPSPLFAENQFPKELIYSLTTEKSQEEILEKLELLVHLKDQCNLKSPIGALLTLNDRVSGGLIFSSLKFKCTSQKRENS